MSQGTKPRIFLVSNLYPSENAPHYGVFVKNFETGLKREGHVFSQKAVMQYGDGGPVLKILRYVHFYFRILMLGWFGDYDLIYVHFISHSAIPVLMVRWFRKKPIVVNAHGSDVLETGLVQKNLGSYVKKLLYKSSSIIVPSGYFKKVVSDKFKIDPHKIHISPSGGINDTIFKPIDRHEARDRFNINDKFVLGFVSRIDEGKGWEDLLLAIRITIEEKKVKDPYLIVAGTGKQKDLFLEELNKLGLNDHVTYLGLVGQEELVAMYNAMDVFVFPSKREAESLGLVGLEAMACGVPLIGSEMGGIKDYLHSGLNGIMFKPGEKQELAEAISTFYHLPDERKIEMGNQALQTAQEYYSQSVSHNLSKHLDSL